VVSPTTDQKLAKSARVADLSSIDTSSEAASTGGYKPHKMDLRRFQQLLEQEDTHLHAKEYQQTSQLPPGGGSAGSGGQGTMSTAPAAQLVPGGRGKLKSCSRTLTVDRSTHAHTAHELKSEKRSAWCDDSVEGSCVGGEGFAAAAEKVCNVRPAASTVVASELSAVPLESSVKSGTGLASVVASNGKSVGSRRQLGKELLARQRGRKGADVGAEVVGDGSTISQNTSRIHADLSRLEQVRDTRSKLRKLS